VFAVYLLKSEAAGEIANSALLLLINDAGLTFLLCSRCVMGENNVPSVSWERNQVWTLGRWRRTQTGA